VNPDEHRHCRVCGKVTAPGNETCSRACREKRETRVRSQQNLIRMMYVLMAIVLIGAILNYVRL
jgi:predicted nucleic acid-binding Zn ribbon protein